MSTLLHRVTVALFALGLWAAPAAATTIERVVSPGGIEAWLVREPAAPLVAVHFAFVGGSAQDPAGKAGTAYLVAAWLGKGAGEFDAKAFQARLYSKAIELGFSAERDTIRGMLQTLTQNRDDAFEDLRLALTAPRFDLTEVEISRGQIMSSLRRAAESPNAVAAERWWLAAFADHPYGHPVMGTLESVPAIGIDDLKAYAHRVLARANLKVAVVGDIDADTVRAMLDRVFGALPADPELLPVGRVAPQGLGRRIVVKLDVPQSSIMFGGPGIARDDPDFMAARLVNQILGGGSFSSRFYQEVREKRGLAYFAYDSLVWLNHAALFLGGTATRPEKTGETLELVEQEIHRMATDGPTADELAEAKSSLNGSFALNLDTSGKYAAMMTDVQLDGLGVDYFTRRPELINAVTLDDARRVAKRLFDTKLLVTVAGRSGGEASTSSE